MKRNCELSWFGVVLGIVLWAVFIIGLGFAARGNWKLFMIGWNIWS